MQNGVRKRRKRKTMISWKSSFYLGKTTILRVERQKSSQKKHRKNMYNITVFSLRALHRFEAPKSTKKQRKIDEKWRRKEKENTTKKKHWFLNLS